MKKIIDIFLRSLLTGVEIAIGGTVYLSCHNKYLGAFLFGIGLFVILSFGFNLFTGKVGSYLGASFFVLRFDSRIDKRVNDIQQKVNDAEHD